MSSGINAIYTPTFKLSIQVGKLRGIAKYMPDEDLRDLWNKNKALENNSKA